MKLKTENEIEEMGYKYAATQLERDKSITGNNSASLLAFKVDHAFQVGYSQAQKDLIEAASEGVFEYFKTQFNSDHYETEEMYLQHKCEVFQIWQAAKLSAFRDTDWMAKRIDEQAKKIEDLERENREMRESLDWATKYSQGDWTETNTSKVKSKEIRQRFNLGKEGV